MNNHSSSNYIASLSGALRILDNLKIKDDHTLFFRGHSSYNYLEIPSIYRAHHINKDIFPYIGKEHDIFREIIMSCPSDFYQCNSAFEYLVKMQHYNIPTRLLDITENPLIALYMACRENKGKGGETGEVIIYQIPNSSIKFYNSDTVSVIANIAKRPPDIKISTLKNLIKKVKNTIDESALLNDKSYNKLMHEIYEEKPYFKKEINLSHMESVICVKPKLDNNRLIRQSGAFFLFGINETKLNPASIPEEYYYKDRGNKITIKVKINGKEKILRELEQLSITEAKLFPEIDKVADFIKEKINRDIK
ncbi:FRG domain-containing protein [Pragia fontium]|uniref:FRG domain-containing protein n=1 Tax=Pragia fontium TaxID=82985 RepID=UPI000F6E65BF|nr:FRG domain-containing protein [Pragia fontium]VEJ53805.1 FRG domain [Pragia fontium]